MKFNIKELMAMQRELDKKIYEPRGLSYDDTRTRQKIALLVEIGETANETRSFKYWSKKGPSAKEVITEELVDCIHFALSFMIDSNNNEYEFKDYKKGDINYLWVKLFTQVSTYTGKESADIFDTILTIAVTLDITGQEIYDGYISKNKENHDRQARGY